MTGSHCTVGAVIPEVQKLRDEGASVTIIFSYAINYTDNRFFSAEDLRRQMEEVSGRPIIDSITGAEPIGPQKLFDVLVVAPCTGNTLAKMANGITDSPALMAVKAHLRNQRPVVIAISTNDGLGLNARNLGVLLSAKNIYFVPFRQDDPVNKATSLVARMDLMLDTIIMALRGKQIQPLLLGHSDDVG